MPTVTIRLDDATRDELEELANNSDKSLSELIREQINVLLGRGIPMRKDASVPHSLSVQQRTILANQHQILELLAADEYERNHHREMSVVLREGYTGEYDSIFIAIDSELTRAQCALVWDILDMFTILQVSIDRLSREDRERLSEHVTDLKFGGFDMNNAVESTMLSYIRFLGRAGKWVEISTHLDSIADNGNSHRRTLPTYERMLSSYRKIRDDRAKSHRFSPEASLFSVDELECVAFARQRKSALPEW